MPVGITLAHTRYVPPAASNFATIVGTNAENPTLADDALSGTVFAFGSSPAVGHNVRGAFKTKPASTAYDVIARIKGSPIGFDFYSFGLAVTDGTKIVTFGIGEGPTNGFRFQIDEWTNSTTLSGSVLSSTLSPGREVCEWFKLTIVAGAPKQFSVSQNGKDWVRIFDTDLSAFLTYTQIGFAMDVDRSASQLPVASTPQGYMSVMYWSDPDITPPV